MRLMFHEKGKGAFITLENGDAPSEGDIVSFEVIDGGTEFIVKKRRFLYHDAERLGYNAVPTLYVLVEPHEQT